ncbi:dihydroxyacetone kinase subunit DhaK [Sciscionella sediminilitoris]|uniref:dihydroxyacetone kinase subunit DhaK n=1 Tax=Sciscionella sediminilitoris TaxID=1445613 RepID=UPI0004DED58D|nr:dihydroxyacetone kinase subunit DhaK [Sciscionella sp. SE31]
MPVRALLNDPDELVAEALDGFARSHPELVRASADPAYLIRADPADKVALVSGGGSGHEPLHTGFVGAGMLDVAVPGAVFASPTAYQIRAAIRAADRGRGVLLVVKNYTGDVLNFGIAAELAAEEGIETRIALVDDDLATESEDGPGRRGTAAVLAVEKICGAAAERGADLDQLAELAARITSSARTLALATAACTHPGESRPSFELAADEVEFGVGIHGEHGIGRRPYGSARELTAALADPLLESLGLTAGEEVLAIVNGLGATHGLELATVARELHEHLAGRGIRITRSLVGSYVTALDMRGCSVTLLRLDPELAELWDAPVRTPALTW